MRQAKAEPQGQDAGLMLTAFLTAFPASVLSQCDNLLLLLNTHVPASAWLWGCLCTGQARSPACQEGGATRCWRCWVVGLVRL